MHLGAGVLVSILVLFFSVTERCLPMSGQSFRTDKRFFVCAAGSVKAIQQRLGKMW
jgi:hypothetical protein